MNGAHILCLAASLVTASGVPAGAHSWYPEECCSDDDCVPADAINADDRGATIVSVGDYRIGIPAGLKPRSSPDGRIHICFQVVWGDVDGSSVTVPICLFLPSQS
jgi:hypothetical protein